MTRAGLRGPRPRPGSIVIGIVRLARGRVDGMQQFGATREAFLASLAPLIAFPLVGGVLMLLAGGGLAVLSDLLATLCALIAPLVLSFEVARLWRRQQFWLRFATAFNWCQWIIPVVGFALLLTFAMLAALGLPRVVARGGVILALVSYGLWLHWFLARHGLALSRVRALLMVFVVNLATVLLVAGPRLVSLGAPGT
ncbi:MAG TPA: hypothetical protein VH855_22220 [Acetobacteraceae bacterium]|jgi:hypothetical protein